MDDNPKSRNRMLRRFVGASITLILLIIVIAAAMSPGIRWRLDVLQMKAMGDLPSVQWSWLIRNVSPGSPVYLEGLATQKNPYSAILNPYDSTADIELGRQLYRSSCLSCHGDASHGSATSLFTGRFKYGDSDWALYQSIDNGIDSTGMLPQKLADAEIWRVIAYLRFRMRDDSNSINELSTAFENFESMTLEERLDGAGGSDDWSTFSGTLGGSRYSGLSELDKTNVESLKLSWVYQGAPHDYLVEASPLIVDGILVTTEPLGSVVALDARNGKFLWRYDGSVPADIRICCGAVNRGVAISGSSVFVGTLDAHLIALDIRSGKEIWNVETAEHSDGYSNTAAPLVVGDSVVVGVGGGEFGIRGFVDAYHVETGERIWRFYTIPATGEPGNESWSGDSWKTGGGPTWMTGSYDDELNLIYWGVGNPGPDFSNEDRSGDNLHSNSIVALNADTGSLEWSFQFTPADVHDYDANHVPILTSLVIDGNLRKVVMSSTKNGFFYVLDARTGEFLSATEITHQTWALSLDANGRPKRNDATIPTVAGTLTYPSAAGGANWWPPSYNRDLGMYFVPVLEGGAIFYSTEDEYEPGELFTAGLAAESPGQPRQFSLKAINPLSSEVLWERNGTTDRQAALTGGTLTTATGLLFWGDANTFYSFDASTGRELWQANLGGQIVAAPVTYSVDDHQYVAISAGRGLFVFSL